MVQTFTDNQLPTLNVRTSGIADTQYRERGRAHWGVGAGGETMVASEKIWALGTEKNPGKEREQGKEETPAEEAASDKTGRLRGLLGNNEQNTFGTLFERECS